MNTNNKTWLITGGGSGIGLELAKLLNKPGNRVVIIGRNQEKLEKAAAGLKYVTAHRADINSPEDVKKLKTWVADELGRLDVLVNNAAGSAHLFSHHAEADAATKAEREFQTNYFSILRLNEVFLPLLQKSDSPAIVNVTSIVAFTPAGTIPVYSDTKAALHSYTQTLRHHLSKTNVKVFELMPPLVNTEFSAAIGGENGMPAIDVAQSLLDGLASDTYEIHVGMTEGFYGQFFGNSEPAFKTLNPA